MGLLKSIGKIGKGVLKVAGKVGKTIAPVVGLVPGVGTLAGGAIGGLSSLASDVGSGKKISLGNALKSGVTGATSGLLGKTLLAGKGLPGLLSKAKGLVSGGGQPGVNTGVENAALMRDAGIGQSGITDALTKAGQTSPYSGGGLLGSIKNLILKNPGKVAGLGLGIANTISAGKQSGEADAARKVALARLQPQAPISLDDTFQGSGNPYATQVPGSSRKTALRALQGAY